MLARTKHDPDSLILLWINLWLAFTLWVSELRCCLFQSSAPFLPYKHSIVSATEDHGSRITIASPIIFASCTIVSPVVLLGLLALVAAEDVFEAIPEATKTFLFLLWKFFIWICILSRAWPWGLTALGLTRLWGVRWAGDSHLILLSRHGIQDLSNYQLLKAWNKDF